ncbi:MAG: amidase [Reyranella sp.]|nr:amidase [Reyranella sp.]
MPENSTERPLPRRAMLKEVGAGVTVLAASGMAKEADAQRRDDDLCLKPAAELLALFKARKVSPVEVLKAQIARAQRLNPQVNCFTHTYFDSAMTAARDSEARWMSGNARALEGITTSVKDDDAMAGWYVTAGSVLLKDERASENSPIVDKLLAAGAVLHAQTTAPEFYFIPQTWSKLWGVTRNPWNLHFTVGGSSGGAGASLAAGFATLATGSDMGGSIRIPSSMNGVYGFKPPHGRVAQYPGGEIMPQSTSGPMARTLGDLALMQSVINGPHPQQMAALRPQIQYPTSYAGIRGWKIAYSFDQGWAVLDPDVRRNTESALKLLEDQGAIVEEVAIAWNLQEIRAALAKVLMSTGMGEQLQQIKAMGRPDDLTTYGRHFVAQAEVNGGARQLAEAQRYAESLFTPFDGLFANGFRAFVCPAVTTTRVVADFDFTASKLLVDGKEVDPLVGWTLTQPFNLMYTIPVVTVPTGLASNRVPTGVQIAARSFEDLIAFQVASSLASAAPQMFTGDLMPDFRNAP